jgi:hypothetical protein
MEFEALFVRSWSIDKRKIWSGQRAKTDRLVV